MTDELRTSLRSSLRQSRRKLSAEQQAAAAKSLFSLVENQEFFRASKRIAFYQSVDGEIDPGHLLELALREGKSCFLPVISEGNPELVSFAPYDTSTELVDNKWGIGEPLSQPLVSATDFNLVFVPLVGFDENCFRLGMGKGFYDRRFGFKIFNRSSLPLLVGLAHESQLTDSLPIANWDVRLDAVVTDRKIYRPNTARAAC